MNDVFIDPRDGNIYKTVEIDNQIWLAENLRFEGVECFAPNGNENNIPKYGYLYTWENAMGACPSGWHLPNKDEFIKSLTYVEKHRKSITNFLALIAKSTVWTSYSNQGGDDFAFGAIPTGYYSGFYSSFGYGTYFWSTTEYNSSKAYYLSLGNNFAGVNYCIKNVACSARCIKD